MRLVHTITATIIAASAVGICAAATIYTLARIAEVGL